MTKLILLLAAILLTLFCSSQIVNIPDANFKSTVVNNPSINTNMDTEIQVSEAEALTGPLNLYHREIYNLTGIEAFINITELNCTNNYLSTLDLSNNTAITKLYCDGNNLSSLNISNCTALTELYCEGNQLASLNINNNTALTWLKFDGNSINNIDLSNNTDLYVISCKGSQLTSLDISNNTGLVGLYCNGNQLSNLDASNNIALTELECHNNQLVSLNLKNGNNTNMSNMFFTAYDNFNLYCIQVDDSAFSAANWGMIDAQSYFSENCYYNINEFQVIELNISPNPFTENFTISLPDNTTNAEVVLYNVLGKQIEITTETSNNKITINGANLKAGVYFVELRDKNRIIANSKIIKQ